MPFSLRFEPNEDVKNLIPKDKPSDYMAYVDQLVSIPDHSILYNVYAMTAPKELKGEEILIGTLVLEGKLTETSWGDEHLFYRHERADDDIKIKPEWKDYYPKYSKGAKCPFAALI